MSQTSIDIENLRYVVQRRFRELGPAGFKARVMEIEPKNDPVHGHDWYLIQTDFDVPVEELFHYYELISRVEEALDKQDHINTLIVPTISE